LRLSRENSSETTVSGVMSAAPPPWSAEFRRVEGLSILVANRARHVGLDMDRRHMALGGRPDEDRRMAIHYAGPTPAVPGEFYMKVRDQSAQRETLERFVVPALTGRAFVVPEGHVARIVCHAGPQIVSGAATADSAQALSSLGQIAATGAQSVLTGHGPVWREGAGAAVERALAAGPS